MRILAIDCATEACSVALFDDTKLLAHGHKVLGRGHAEHLIPMIKELPDRGMAERILVSLGPGSFTGLRIGIAAARALGVAWHAQVLGYPTLTLVAAQAWQPTPRHVTVCMNGGHGEWFVQNFDGSAAEDEVSSLTPDEAAAACKHEVVIGNRAEELATLLERKALAIPMLPDARKANLLHESELTDDLRLIYGRAPDAKLPSKAAEKQ